MLTEKGTHTLIYNSSKPITAVAKDDTTMLPTLTAVAHGLGISKQLAIHLSKLIFAFFSIVQDCLGPKANDRGNEWSVVW